jgi:hypothetical protein
LFAVLAIGSPSLANIVVGPVINPANGHNYYLLSENSWTASEAEAVSLGGTLATINNLAENTWVAQTFGQLPGASSTRFYDLWIGYNDSSSEGTFTWISGETPGFTNISPNSNPNSDLNDFFSIVPHDQGGTPLGQIAQNQWNLVSDTAGFRLGVVEVVPEPGSTLAILGFAMIGLLRRSHRR